jgi:transcriptional regulator with XRE-family HTH domain
MPFPTKKSVGNSQTRQSPIAKPLLSEKGLKFAIVGKNLKIVLKAKGITKWRLAKDLGISYRTIQYWEKNQTLPSDENAKKVAAYLGIDVQVKNGKLSIIENHEHRLQAIEKKLGLPAILEKEGE